MGAEWAERVDRDADLGHTVRKVGKENVSTGLDRLEKTIDGVSSSLDVLEGRLERVLGPDFPRVVDDPESKRPDGQSPMADRVDRLTAQVSSLYHRIESLLDRVEV